MAETCSITSYIHNNDDDTDIKNIEIIAAFLMV